MLKRWFQNWWQGWSDEDLKSVREKIAQQGPGEVRWVTKREWKAFVANDPSLN